MARIVITGAAGFIGMHTVRELLKKGYNVEAVDIRTERLKEFSNNKRLAVHEIDIIDEDFNSLVKTGDKVLHLGAVASFGQANANPQHAVRVNVEGTINVVRACIEKKAERIVYSSTGSVYAVNSPLPIREDAPTIPNNIYGLSKKASEEWITFFKNQLRFVILRYGYVYGCGKDWGAIGAFLKNIYAGERPVVFGGKQTNDFVYVKDVVDANLLALETPYVNQIYNIGTGRATSIKDVCELCLKATGRSLEMKLDPPRSFDFPIFVYDIDKARALLRFEPKWNVFDGIDDVVKKGGG